MKNKKNEHYIFFRLEIIILSNHNTDNIPISFVQIHLFESFGKYKCQSLNLVEMNNTSFSNLETTSSRRESHIISFFLILIDKVLCRSQ